jgi:hypothetical protein
MKKLAAALQEANAFQSYILIAVPIILFNLVAVFGPKVLLQDDAANYFNVISGNFPFWFWRKGLFLCSLTEWLSWNIMAFSPQLIRVIYVLFLMIPLSCVMYRLFRKLGFANNTAYMAAILPNILPAQNLVPAFLNGSYVLIGLLAMLGCFICSFKYLDTEEKSKRKMLFLALLFLIISTQLMDQAVFFLPVLLVAVLGYQKLNRKHLFLAFSFVPAVLYKAVWVLLLPRQTAEIVPLTGSIIVSRIRYYFFSMLPLPDFLAPYIDVVLIAVCIIIISGLVLTLKAPGDVLTRQKPFSHLSHRQYILYIYGFLLTWTICNIAPFIAMSKFQTVRYSFIAAYGLTALWLISLSALLKKFFKTKPLIIQIVFTMIILFVGFTRTAELKSYYDGLNNKQNQIVKNLSPYHFPPNSQIVIYLTNAENYWGFWVTSSGHLKLILQRNDINGLIGSKTKHYFEFYDPFNPKSRGFKSKDRMNGLSIDRPLFLFVEHIKDFNQYEYALQWQGTTRDAPWTIHKIDRFTGTILPFTSGRGRQEYELKVKELAKIGILQTDILWGCPLKEIYRPLPGPHKQTATGLFP